MFSRLTSRRVGGFVLIAFGVALFTIVVPYTISFGLFFVWLSTILILFIITQGCYLILNMSFRSAVEWWLSALIVTLLAWIVVLPIELQILTISLIGFSLATLLYWHYQKLKAKKLTS